ncbi:DUF3107 domain-containing protein [Alloscardovia venturai]|uniref:DUF3107 domain-containing protein n=1 Tax=Alloscardovia venturai TaxID=1769421 RepID=A0ABW2Y778_9BIFI
MNVEIGIHNVPKVISFETNESATDVSHKIDTALNNHETLQLTDEKGRVVIVPSDSLGYVILGTETAHPVGFGAL